MTSEALQDDTASLEGFKHFEDTFHQTNQTNLIKECSSD